MGLIAWIKKILTPYPDVPPVAWNPEEAAKRLEHYQREEERRARLKAALAEHKRIMVDEERIRHVYADDPSRSIRE